MFFLILSGLGWVPFKLILERFLQAGIISQTQVRARRVRGRPNALPLSPERREIQPRLGHHRYAPLVGLQRLVGPLFRPGIASVSLAHTTWPRIERLQKKRIVELTVFHSDVLAHGLEQFYQFVL